SSSQIVRRFYRVLLHLREIHRPALEFFVVRLVRFSRSALVPLHHGEVFLPGILKSASHGNKRDAGPTMDEQKNRVIHCGPGVAFIPMGSTFQDPWEKYFAVVQ